MWFRTFVRNKLIINHIQLQHHTWSTTQFVRSNQLNMLLQMWFEIFVAIFQCPPWSLITHIELQRFTHDQAHNCQVCWSFTIYWKCESGLRNVIYVSISACSLSWDLIPTSCTLDSKTKVQDASIILLQFQAEFKVDVPEVVGLSKFSKRTYAS